MIQEEKLVKLLQVAVENGWQPTCRLQDYIIYQEESFEITPNGCVQDHQTHEEHKSFSLNDLVTNWEEGEVSFIEALCNQSLTYNDDGIPIKPKAVVHKLHWTLQPTSKRLEFLFNTFNHLL